MQHISPVWRHRSNVVHSVGDSALHTGRRWSKHWKRSKVVLSRGRHIRAGLYLYKTSALVDRGRRSKHNERKVVWSRVEQGVDDFLRRTLDRFERKGLFLRCPHDYRHRRLSVEQLSHCGSKVGSVSCEDGRSLFGWRPVITPAQPSPFYFFRIRHEVDHGDALACRLDASQGMPGNKDVGAAQSLRRVQPGQELNGWIEHELAIPIIRRVLFARMSREQDPELQVTETFRSVRNGFPLRQIDIHDFRPGAENQLLVWRNTETRTYLVAAHRPFKERCPHRVSRPDDGRFGGELLRGLSIRFTHGEEEARITNHITEPRTAKFAVIATHEPVGDSHASRRLGGRAFFPGPLLARGKSDKVLPADTACRIFLHQLHRSVVERRPHPELGRDWMPAAEHFPLNNPECLRWTCVHRHKHNVHCAPPSFLASQGDWLCAIF